MAVNGLGKPAGILPTMLTMIVQCDWSYFCEILIIFWGLFFLNDFIRYSIIVLFILLFYKLIFLFFIIIQFYKFLYFFAVIPFLMIFCMIDLLLLNCSLTTYLNLLLI